MVAPSLHFRSARKRLPYTYQRDDGIGGRYAVAKLTQRLSRANLNGALARAESARRDERVGSGQARSRAMPLSQPEPQ